MVAVKIENKKGRYNSGRQHVRRLIAGYSLLEILIALFILAFGLLSLASAGSAALRRSHDAYLSSLAIVEAANLLEAVQAGDESIYKIEWSERLVNILPNGEGGLSKRKNGYQDFVCWTQHFQQRSKRCVQLGIDT